jgi:hypothetical protein
MPCLNIAGQGDIETRYAIKPLGQAREVQRWCWR